MRHSIAFALALSVVSFSAAHADGAAAPAPTPEQQQKLINDLIQDAAKPAPPALTAPAAAPTAPIAVMPEPAPGPDERRAAELLRTGQKPPVITRSSVIRYPFGESQPIVECEPLRACDIELQAGETILGVAIGDSERWTTSPLNSGDPANLTPHVIVKPKDFGIATNLIVSTTRRTYHLGLTSPSKDQASSTPYLHAVGFYFPAEMVQQWASNEMVQAIASSRRAAVTAVSFGSGDPSTFHYDYSVSTKGRVAWVPTLVLDDGAHTYIKFPPAIRASDAPVLMATLNNTTAALNYRTSQDGLWYIADGLYDHLQLVVGTGRHQTTVDIARDSR